VDFTLKFVNFNGTVTFLFPLSSLVRLWYWKW